MTIKTRAAHPFGELLTQFRQRKPGLTQTQLAELAGYDQAILVRMVQGKKDLTGPSGRDRVISLINILREERVLIALDEANALLAAAQMPPLYEGLPVERALIRSLKPSVLPSPAVATTPAEISQPQRYRLPARWTSFIGRDEALSEIRRLLTHSRLVTLTGAGGSGKTRLALEAAASLTDSFANGACFVSLATLSDPDQMPDAIALALQVKDTPGRSVIEQLKDFLRKKELLLLIDNFEHLLPAASIVTELLAAADHLKIIATSRETLRLYGEHEFVVEPLPEQLAVELFTHRAQAVRNKFALTDENLGAVVGICRWLDGLPLAIELAASRIRQFTPHTLLQNLSGYGSSHRLDALADGPRDVDARHQMLRSTIDWSYELLSEPEKITFRQLGVFAGGWELDQAGQVVSDAKRNVLPLLTQLASKSMVIVEEQDDAMRYRLLETMREYALERLREQGEMDAALHRHADAYVQLSEQAYMGVQGSDQRRWFARLEREYPNLSAALHWSFSQAGSPLLGCHMVSVLQLPWRSATSHQHDIWRWMHQAFDVLTDDMPARIQGGIWLGRTLVKVNTNVPEALLGLQKSLAYYKVAGDLHGISDAQGQIGIAMHMSQPDNLAGLRMLEDAIALSRSLGNTLIEHWQAKSLAWLYQTRNEFERAEALRIEVIDSCHRTSDLATLTVVLYEHANQLLELMMFEEALRYGEESAQLARQINDPRSEMCARGIITECVRYLGDIPHSVVLNEELLAFTRERLGPLDLGLPILLTAKSLNDAGNHGRAQLLLAELMTLLTTNFGATRGYYSHAFDTAACVASSRGDARRSARLFGAADAEIAATNERRFQNNDMEIAPYIAKARAALGDAAYESAYAEGHTMTLEQAIDYALGNSTDG